MRRSVTHGLMSWPPGQATGLEGIVPAAWLQRDRWLRETDDVMVILHPEPAAMGHAILYPKAHSPRLEDCNPRVLCSIGMLVGEVKRAVRLVTGYRDYVMILRSGRTAGQTLDHIYFELLPTIHTKPTFRIDWDPSNKRGRGDNDCMTKKATYNLVATLRREMGMHNYDGLGCVLLETDRLTVEFVDVPASTAHMMISPKEVSPDFEDCDPVAFGGCLWQLPKICKALKNTIHLENFFVLSLNGPDAGQTSAHLTVQLVPCSWKRASLSFEQITTVKPTLKTTQNMTNAIKQILKQEIITLALGETSYPKESSWSRPISQQGVNPVGTASPSLIRARSPHPALDGWVMNAKTHKVRDRPGTGASDNSMRPGSEGSMALSSQMGSRPGSRLATPGGVFQRSALQSIVGARGGERRVAGTTGISSVSTRSWTEPRPPGRLSILSSRAGTPNDAGVTANMQSRILSELDSLLQVRD